MASTLLSSPAMSMTAVAPVKTSVVGLRPLEVCKAPSSTRSKKSKSASTTKAMLVWPNKDNIKFETLSYLPPLTQEQLSKEIDYLLRNKWVPCLEFDEEGTISRKYGATPGYYDGRYWTMWKLPMFGCNDSALVLREIEEVKKAYPKAFVRCIGFDNNRQVQCISFIVHKPY